ncbi:D-inositol-3-phosphate glycosyltransferase [Dermatophilus congolensis]|uniref:D-inositol-3-phosphate glycosyltransferase n=1 Tax=Dermatophilus congolensis TaxID=1863 RepID=A0A239VEM5_9MICO|nr:D-inositol-3-phosphate glycosyltransferase [Dermatophilus congolensis]SNV19994.1 D-inositol-3-phosphate glycosyltransferase [Dermatophilus congolensis]
MAGSVDVQAPVRRVAMLSFHTSPLDQPGTGDAGGMNVYVVEVARHLAAMGVEVVIFTRKTSASLPDEVQLCPGVVVRHVLAGPYEGLDKNLLPSQLCAFAAGVMREVAGRPEGHYDVVHSHYWLSGQVGWLAAQRWNVPLVHTMHTMAKVKNALLAPGDAAEPLVREIGEEQVVSIADRLVANTVRERDELVSFYGASADVVEVVPPGVDLETFTPGDPRVARAVTGLPEDALVVCFVGRIQPLKAPDLLVDVVADVASRRPDLGQRLRLVVIGGPSGTGLERPRLVLDRAAELGVEHMLLTSPPVEREVLAQWYRSADIVGVPSHNESFGLVAIEAQACGVPVVAAAVGGLPTAVKGGVLVPTHDVGEWSLVFERLLDDADRRAQLGRVGYEHAQSFGWAATAERVLEVYADAVAHRRGE